MNNTHKNKHLNNTIENGGSSSLKDEVKSNVVDKFQIDDEWVNLWAYDINIDYRSGGSGTFLLSPMRPPTHNCMMIWDKLERNESGGYTYSLQPYYEPDTEFPMGNCLLDFCGVRLSGDIVTVAMDSEEQTESVMLRLIERTKKIRESALTEQFTDDELALFDEKMGTPLNVVE